MNLRKIEIAPDHEIKHEIFCVEMPSASYLDILIMKFIGIYGYGSSGNTDASYMTAITKAAISFTQPFGLIFDFTELTYEWGDMMSEVLFSGEGRWLNQEMPMAVIVSHKCEEAIKSLLTQELQIKDLSILHRSLDSAVAFIDEKYRFGQNPSVLNISP